MEIYLAEAERFVEVVKAYRAAKEAASAETPLIDKCNETPAPTKRRSYNLPPLKTPSEIPGYPLNPSPPAEAPDYGNLARVKATRAAQAERRGKRAPLTPGGPSRLVKRGSQ
jgi:hypothetical protein